MSVSTAIDALARASVLGVKTEFLDLGQNAVAFLPQQIAIIGQGSTLSTYTTTKARHTKASDVGSAYGFGSPLHLAALQLLPSNGDGVGSIPVYFLPLQDDDGSSAASAGDVTPSGTQTVAASYIVRINNIDSDAFVINPSDSVATIITAMIVAVNAVLEMPMIASDGTTTLDLTAKWKGTSTNDLIVEIIGSATAGTSFALTQPVGGLINPDVDDALNLIGTQWITMALNCMEIADTTSLDKISTFGETRWGPTERKPLVSFVGNTIAGVTAATAVSDARKTDRVNSQLVAPGSSDIPFIVAARQLARITVQANNNPSVNYNKLAATGLTPGLDSEQWTFLERDEAFQLGSSSIEVEDATVLITDVITFYQPTGESNPAFQYVVDIVKLQTIIFNLDLEFASIKWMGKPLLPDEDPTVNPDARQPKMAVAAVAAIVDSLGLNAIISSPQDAKASIVASINQSNPKRLDLCFTVQLVGNVQIISVDFNFGFKFGEITTLN